MMEKGKWVTNTRIKADAAPIDNVTKFAWDDSDYEEFEEWIEYSAEELAEREAQAEAAAKKEEQEKFLEGAPARIKSVETCLTALTSAFGEVE